MASHASADDEEGCLVASPPPVSPTSTDDASSPSPASAPPAAPAGATQIGGIRKLDESVVNRIAAGEILHRPANAVKELLENSIDAKSTTISIVAKAGGCKLLQIVDNGHGIKKDDLALLCERFATSKLVAYEDLRSINTYGFRGEALASISHVAHVSVTTMTAEQPCAYKYGSRERPLTLLPPTSSVKPFVQHRAKYLDGRMIEGPKPCAGNRGTLLTVEDLFYNVATRRRALKTPSEEYTRILDIVTRYALHNSGISISCKKHGSNTADVQTTVGASINDNLRLLFGPKLAREILQLSIEDSNLSFSAQAFVSNPNYNMKKATFILFINHRLVESTNVKRAIDNVYTAYLPKNTHPFVYLSLVLPPDKVDVNVHPTKREVHFLDEDRVIERVQRAIDERLLSCSHSRTFYTQPGSMAALSMTPTLSTTSTTTTTTTSSSTSANFESQSQTTRTSTTQQSPRASTTSGRPIQPSSITATASSAITSPATPQHKLVRTDPKARTLDAFVTPTRATTGSASAPRTTTTPSVAPSPRQNEATALMLEHDDIIDDEDDVTLDEDNAVTKNRQRAANDMTLESALDLEHDDDDDDQQLELEGSDSAKQASDDAVALKRRRPYSPPQAARKRARKQRVPVQLTSIRNLLAQVAAEEHKGLSSLFNNHTFVGCADANHCLIQHQTKLYLVNVCTISQELVYQTVLQRFSTFESIRLAVPVSIQRITKLALDSSESGWSEEDGDKDKIAQWLANVLQERAEMLKEYFGIEIASDGALVRLPQIIDNYVPDMRYLPLFILRLGTEVTWDQEQECFESISRELATFYQLHAERDTATARGSNAQSALSTSSTSSTSDTTSTSSSSSTSAPSRAARSTEASARAWSIEHTFSPALRGVGAEAFLPPRRLANDGSIVQIACLEKLYHIFERC